MSGEGVRLTEGEREALEAACLEGLVYTQHGWRYDPSIGADAVEAILADRTAALEAELAEVRGKVARVEAVLATVNGAVHFSGRRGGKTLAAQMWRDLRAALDGPSGALGGEK